jgi:signal transduction histidine kinase/ActR/RegA family two-component response regulator
MSPDWSEMRRLQGQSFLADTDSPDHDWLHKYIRPDDQPHVMAVIRTAIRERQTFELEHRVVRADGTIGWTYSKAIPLTGTDGEVVEWFGAASDVTARKEAEAKLQSQLARLHLLRQITHAIAERQDIQGIFHIVVRTLEEHLPADFCCICSYDPAANRLTVMNIGLRSASLATELAMSQQAHIEVDQNGLSSCVKGRLVHEPNIPALPFPFPQRLARGGLRSMVAAPLLDQNGVFGILIAARREAHSFSSGECEFLQQLSEHVALATNQAQLHQTLQRAYDDLRQTQEAVLQQERLLALGKMASGIAHDINNAISPIGIYTEMLLEREPGLSPRTRDYLEIIQRAIDDVAQTVARMREFYRVRESQQQLLPVDMNSLVPQVIELTRARWNDMAQQRGVTVDVRTDLSADLPAILGIESELRDVLTNLIFNAVDAMSGGGRLTVRTHVEPAPKPGTSTQERVVHLEVVDTGIGMDEETRRRCLEPFFTTKGERGTGLGLAMVYGCMQRHGADIDIRSIVGQGTTVRLSFTVPAIESGDVTPTALVQVISSRRILVVDDDPLILNSLRDTLEGDGHIVRTADGGQAGVDAFSTALGSSEPFQIVITDLGMPYLDGRKVATAVKAAAPGTVVLLLTGWGQRMVEDGDTPPYVDRVLSKPPKLRELRAALAELVNQRV